MTVKIKKTATDEQKSSVETYASVVIRAGAMLQAAEKRQKKGDATVNSLLAEVLQDMTSAKKIKLVAGVSGLEVNTFPIWKAIQLGTGLKSDKDFQQALESGGHKTSGRAKDIMSKSDFASSISSVVKKVNLCAATTQEIIGRSGTTAEVFAGIKTMSGKLLPAEAGPQLRLQYQNQPKGEGLLIAMNPIKDSVGAPYVFCVKCVVDGLWLSALYDFPGHLWYPDYRWVFALRK